jgi:hypothetical protein
MHLLVFVRFSTILAHRFASRLHKNYRVGRRAAAFFD